MASIPRVSTRRVSGVNRAGLTTQSGVSTRVHVFGVREALAKFRLVHQVAFRDTGLMTRDSAMFIERRAKELVPKRTHDLEKGIKAKKTGVYNWQVTASSVEGGSDREYAAHVEYGWSGHPEPEHYMRNAAAEGRQRLRVGLTALSVKLSRL